MRKEWQNKKVATREMGNGSSDMTPSSSSSYEDPGLSTIQEVTETSTTTTTAAIAARRVLADVRQTATASDGIDSIPVRGPSSAEDEEKRSQQIVMGGPSSAFSSVSPEPRRQQRFASDGINELLAKVEKQQKELVTSGSGAGAKNDEADRNFVAKVLGISPADLDKENDEKVRVRVNIEEVSSTQQQTLATLSSESSSSSITRERFLNQPMVAGPIQKSQPEKDEGDFVSVQGLIKKLKSSTSAAESSTPSERRREQERQVRLRDYIERLLEMRRDEIAQLSVTESSLTTTVEDSTGSPSASTNNSKSFLASTPTSILSTSDSRSSVGSKTVRFQDVDDADGSFLKRDQPSDNDIKKMLKQIEERTEKSMAEVRKSVDERRKELEQALTERLRKRLAKQLREQQELVRSQKQHQKPLSRSASSIISEGPLSDSTTTEEERARKPKKSHSDSSILTDSAKESSASSDHGGEGRDVMRPFPPKTVVARSKRTESAQKNKSSSSGSSGSQAVADLRAKLNRLEIPALVRPPPVPHSTSDDTIAKVAELPVAEEASEEFSSFHFTPDEEGISDEKEISFGSLASFSDTTSEEK